MSSRSSPTRTRHWRLSRIEIGHGWKQPRPRSNRRQPPMGFFHARALRKTRADSLAEPEEPLRLNKQVRVGTSCAGNILPDADNICGGLQGLACSPGQNERVPTPCAVEERSGSDLAGR